MKDNASTVVFQAMRENRHLLDEEELVCSIWDKLATFCGRRLNDDTYVMCYLYRHDPSSFEEFRNTLTTDEQDHLLEWLRNDAHVFAREIGE